MIKAEIVADSMSPAGKRLTTYVLSYPRFIHAEFMTHRLFSRNASSSRAIPVNKTIEEIINNPAVPLAFRKNQKGMQAGAVLEDQDRAIAIWLKARDNAVEQAREMVDMDIHKQYANRILEPFAHITVVCTATEFDNFFSLRVHPAAQPEICELATQMYELYRTNTPKAVKVGYWHLPLVTEEEIKECCAVTHVNCLRESDFARTLAVKRSVAKCARVSYKNHDGTKNTMQQDLDLYDRLLGQVPIHASPAEHQAMAMNDDTFQSGNFYGWLQYRKTLPNEHIGKYEAQPIHQSG